ncbi:rRNA biogenesis protein rrp36 [Mactra antiquata]
MGKRNIVSDHLQSNDDEPVNKKMKSVVGSKGNKASSMLNKQSMRFTAKTSYQNHSKFIEPASSSSESDSDDEGEEISDADTSADNVSDDESCKIDNKVIVKNDSKRKHIGQGSSKASSANESDNDHDSDDDDDNDDDDDDDDSSEEDSKISVEKGHNRKNVEMGGNKKNISSNINDDSDDSDDDDDDDNDESSDSSQDDEDISENDDEKEPRKKTADVDEEDELAVLKRELANIPLQDLIKVKEKIGLKVFNKLMHGETLEKKRKKEFKRENKNRPMEISSKRRVPILRQTGVTKEMVRRDPRFDDLSGEYREEHFLKDYSFINDIKDKERELIQAKMRKTKDENKRHEMGRLLSKMKQQQQSDNAKQKKMELEKLWKEKEKQLIKDGKNPYFLKKSEKKKLELAEKYKELKESGKIEKYLSKKLKKNAQKERKKLPRQRQQFS